MFFFTKSCLRDVTRLASSASGICQPPRSGAAWHLLQPNGASTLADGETLPLTRVKPAASRGFASADLDFSLRNARTTVKLDFALLQSKAGFGRPAPAHWMGKQQASANERAEPADADRAAATRVGACLAENGSAVPDAPPRVTLAGEARIEAGVAGIATSAGVIDLVMDDLNENGSAMRASVRCPAACGVDS